jgi:thymidylate synthase ThyX
MITITGKNGIRATILAHSITAAGKEMTTWEVEYPRLILAELNTHRQLSRNSYSSRAVPFLKMLEQLDGEPVRFGANQAGMQDKGEDFNALVWMDILNQETGITENKPFYPKQAWGKVKNIIIKLAEAFYAAGYHKQVYNRLLESFQMQKTVLSATETDNFFWLRDDDAADPTIRELARVMREAKDQSVPSILAPGEWHLPYVDWIRDERGLSYYIEDVDKPGQVITLSLGDAIKVSCARCAAVSYRNEGYGLVKSLEVYDRLVGTDRKHASAFEHQATPIQTTTGSYLNGADPRSWEAGISHMDRDYQFWSGNLCGWVQYRKLIPDECYSSNGPRI